MTVLLGLGRGFHKRPEAPFAGALQILGPRDVAGYKRVTRKSSPSVATDFSSLADWQADIAPSRWELDTTCQRLG